MATKKEAAANALRDIEDFTAINPITNPALQKKQEQAALKNAQKDAEAKFSKMEDCPNPDEDFGTWLKYQKTNWRKIRKMMKDDKKVIANQGRASKHLGLTSFIRNMDEVVLKSNWHIVQISETFEPGILKVWALTEQGQMFNVKLRINRTIYINSKVVCNEAEFKKVNKLLPRGRKTYHLYEWEKSEDVFIEKFHNINYHHLLNHTVEGVYETKMPLLFRALMDLGCMVKPRYSVIPRTE